MEILRVSPFADIPVTFTVPAGYNNVDLTATVTDLADFSTTEVEYEEKDSGDIIEIILPGTYDNSYGVQIITSNGSVIMDQVYDVVRPYVDPATLSESGSSTEIQEYKTFELVARSIIDTYLNYGFYNKKVAMQTTGQGGDYLPLWNPANSILKVYENNVLAYDAFAEDPSKNLAVYTITPDRTAIQRLENNLYNRAEASLRYLFISSGDIYQDAGRLVAFPSSYDYTVILDSGYKSIPADLEYAAKLLIEDLKCGRLDYYKRYTTNYSTDQYKIQFDKAMIDGTGNLLVDKILDKYVLSLKRPGII
jgi:hypothetical protein